MSKKGKDMSMVYMPGSALGLTEDEQKRQSDMLTQAGQLGGQPAQATQEQAQQGVDPLQKQVTGLDLAGGNVKPVEEKQAIQSDANKIVKANVGENFAQGLDKSASDTTSRYKNEMQTQADAWSKAAQRSAFDTTKVDQFAADGSNADDLKTRLSSGYSAPTEFSYDIGNNNALSALMSGEGQASLIRDQAGPQYSAGMSALDGAILKRQKNQFDSAIKDNAELRNVYQSIIDKSRQTIDSNKSAYDAETQGIKTRLGDTVSALQAQNQKEVDDWNLGAQAQVQGFNIDYANKTKGVRDEYLNKFGQSLNGLQVSDKSKAAARQAMENLKPDGFVKNAALPQASANDMFDENEATRYNRIMELLGNGERKVAGKAKAVDQGAFDEATMRKAYDAQMQAALAPLQSEDAINRTPISTAPIATTGNKALDTMIDRGIDINTAVATLGLSETEYGRLAKQYAASGIKNSTQAVGDAAANTVNSVGNALSSGASSVRNEVRKYIPRW